MFLFKLTILISNLARNRNLTILIHNPRRAAIPGRSKSGASERVTYSPRPRPARRSAAGARPLGRITVVVPATQPLPNAACIPARGRPRPQQRGKPQACRASSDLRSSTAAPPLRGSATFRSPPCHLPPQFSQCPHSPLAPTRAPAPPHTCNRPRPSGSSIRTIVRHLSFPPPDETVTPRAQHCQMHQVEHLDQQWGGGSLVLKASVETVPNLTLRAGDTHSRREIMRSSKTKWHSVRAPLSRQGPKSRLAGELPIQARPAPRRT